MTDEKYYRKAAEIVREVMKKEKARVKPGVKVLDLTEEIEDRIKRKGGKPAFPVNVSINEVAAHYSPTIKDETEIKQHDVVKVDVGVHVEGYIVDAAWTFIFNEKHRNLVKTTDEALMRAVEAMKPGKKTGEIGAVIEKTIKKGGYKPISNLSGHMLRRYVLHAGKSIPNVKTMTFQKIKEGEVYAVEPFATNGKGEVRETNRFTIFRLMRRVNVYGTSLEDRVTRYIQENYGTLPFASRWLAEKFEATLAQFALRRLVKKGVIHPYGVLIEVKGGLVAQSETTVIVSKSGALRLL